MLEGEWNAVNLSPVNKFLFVLGSDSGPSLPAPPSIPNAERRSLLKVRLTLEQERTGQTRDFLVKKLTRTSDFFAGAFASEQESIQSEFLASGGLIRGAVDSINDLGNSPAAQVAVFNTVRQLNFDGLGSSSFQGLVYTNGGFFADNQVTVLGAVVVNDDGSQEPFDTPGGEVEPGELHLLSLIHI